LRRHQLSMTDWSPLEGRTGDVWGTDLATARRGEFDRAPAGIQATGGPTVLRMTLGGQLRRLREDHGISREQAGEAIRGSHAKISRLELGRVGFKGGDISDLLPLYGGTGPGGGGAFP